MIKNLVFDFGNVLVNHDLHPLLGRCFDGDEMRKTQFLEILSNRDFIDACDRGIISFDGMLKHAIQKNPEFRDAFLQMTGSPT